MGKLIVASYCSTFLKPEMLHIYRQITALKRVDTFVMAKTIEHGRRFPFPDLEKIPRPHRNYLRHGWMKFVERRAPLLYRGEYQEIVSILERRAADVMHIYFGHTGVHLLPFIREWHKPSIVSFHGVDVGENRQVGDYQGKLRVLFDSVVAVLARSQSIADRLVSLGCAREKISLNRTGIPMGEFPFIQRRTPRDRCWRILQACRLIDKKGLATAIRAFAIFQQFFPEAEFVIAGKGELQPELEELAHDLGVRSHVRFVGFLGQRDLRELYARAHIFLHPSEMPPDQNQEGVPNAVLEAMATGLPVVATRHGGIPEAVTDGVSGLLSKEKDADGLGASLLRLATTPDLYERCSAAAHRAVADQFEQHKTVSALERVYEKAAASRRAPALAKGAVGALPLAESVTAK